MTLAFGTSRPINPMLRLSTEDRRAGLAQRYSPGTTSTIAAGYRWPHNDRRIPSLFAITDNGSGRAGCKWAC